MQLKYSFKKEFMQFFRTFRFAAVLLIYFGFAVGNPLMFKFCAEVLGAMDTSMSDTVIPGISDSNTGDENKPEASTPESKPESKPSSPTDIFGSMTLDIASDSTTNDTPPTIVVNPDDPTAALNSMLGDMGMGDILELYSDAGIMFCTSISTFSGAPLIVIMLLLMSTAGGEQKKRAMIVPMCSGLQYKNYLLPKFVIYPLTIFATTFLASMTAGGLCNLMFENNKISSGMVALISLLISIYIAFIISVYFSLGLCSSKPAVMVALVYVGQMIISTLLNGMGLTDYQPFALLNATGGTMVMEGFDLEAKIPSLIVSAVLAIAISVAMYFLALGVLGAKKTNNRAENEPEF